MAAEQFDPTTHTVQEVQDHLDTSDTDEYARVQEAERAGKGRQGILGHTQDPDKAEPDEDGYTRVVISS